MPNGQAADAADSGYTFWSNFRARESRSVLMLPIPAAGLWLRPQAARNGHLLETSGPRAREKLRVRHTVRRAAMSQLCRYDSSRPAENAAGLYPNARRL